MPALAPRSVAQSPRDLRSLSVAEKSEKTSAMLTRKSTCVLLLALLRECGGAATRPPMRVPLRAASGPLARAVLSMQDMSSEGAAEEAPDAAAAAAGGAFPSEPVAAPVAAPPRTPELGPDGKPDLSQMSFDERLEYLASVAPDVAAPAEEAEVLFGVDFKREETQFWNPKFLMLCFQDLQEMTWPTPTNVAQTLVISQIAFLAIFVSILVFDAFAEGFIRTLIQGKPFQLVFDGSASPSRGI